MISWCVAKPLHAQFNASSSPLTGNYLAMRLGGSNHTSDMCLGERIGFATSQSIPKIISMYAVTTPIVIPPAPVCIGDSVTLSVSSVINNGDIFNWYADSMLYAFVDSGATVQLGPITSNRVYYVTLTNARGVTSRPVSVPVTVFSTSPPPTILTGNNYCEGMPIVLTTTAVSSEYKWTSNTGWNSTDSASAALVTTQANASHAGTYHLQIKDNNGCWSSTASLTITINNTPSPPVAYSNSPICEGENLHLLTTANCGQLQWYGSSGANNAVVMPSDTDYMNGSQWYVKCTDTLTGCSSISNSIAIQINTLPTISAVTINLPNCKGDNLSANATALSFSGNSVKYSWYSDSTRTTLLGAGDSLFLLNVHQSFSLYLVVTDTGTTCEQTDVVPVTVHSLPASPTIAGNLMYCEGDSLLLSTPVVASQYYWTGPNGWVSTSVQSKQLLTVLDSGVYYLSVADSNGCFSSSSNVRVVVNPLPNSFTIYNGGGVCAGQDANFGIAGGSTASTYNWYQLPSNTYIGRGANLTLQNVQASDSTYYYAVATLNGCSVSSDTLLLPVWVPTAIAQAGATQLLCGSDTTRLIAQAIPNSVTGFWTSSSPVVIQQPNSPTTPIGPLPLGRHIFYWRLSNTTCANFSTDSVMVEVLPATLEQANAGLDQNYCATNSVINLWATAPQIGTGCWVQSSRQSNLGAVIVDSLSPTTSIRGLQEGQQYTFVWQLKNGRCGIYSVDTVLITIDSLPRTVAFAGTDQTSCEGDSISLQALAAPNNHTGSWTSLGGGVVIYPNQPTSKVIDLPTGNHQFVWTLSTNNCPNYSRDTITVIVGGEIPIARADYFTLSSNATTIDVTSNDQLPNNWIIKIQQTINQGQLTNLNNGKFRVNLSDVTQQQRFIYQLCNANCVNNCDTTIVLLSVKNPINCPIPNIFTPNNDGINDQFEIPCISEKRSAYLVVYNRWGDEVYRSDNYQNQWKGTHAGAALPDGTYFYILQLMDGIKIQGSVEIRR